MKVCHIGCGWNPYPGGNAIRAVNLIQSLYFHSGVESIVVTGTADASGQYTSPVAPEIMDKTVIYRVKGFQKMVYMSVRALITHDVDLLHTHNLRMFWVMAIFKVWKPIVLELHALPQVSGLKRIGLILSLLYANHVIVLSEACKDYLVSHYQTPKEKITVIRNGINIEKFSLQYESMRNGQNQCKVGYVGTFYEWQGVFDFVEAVPYVLEHSQKVMFHMIGQGPDYEAVKKRSDELGLQNHIVFHGPIPSASVPKMLHDLDVVVIPRPSTLATETTVPLKVFEFMAAGKAIIASDVAGLMEVLSPGQDCLVYRAGSVMELAKAIGRLADNQELRENLGENAVKNVNSQPSWGVVADNLKNLYFKQLR